MALIHMWNGTLEDTLCNAGIDSGGRTLDRGLATCVQCLDRADTIQLALYAAEKIAEIKNTAAVLKVKLDRLQPAGDTLKLLLSQIEAI